jgi:hypothetical protein
MLNDTNIQVMNLEAIRIELAAIDNATSERTLQGDKQYTARIINKFVAIHGEPHKFDMSDEAMFYNFAMSVYNGLHIF